MILVVETKRRSLLFSGPVHQRVCGNERRGDVEDLVTETAEGVEDGGVPEVREHALAIGGEEVCCNALLRSGN